MYRKFPARMFVAVLCSLAGVSSTCAAPVSIAGSVSDGSATVPYQLYEPQGTAPGQKVPLILYLHGAGERGTDNTAQTTWMGNLTAKTSGGQYAAYVLAPQINSNMWFSSSGSAPSEGMSLTMQALKQAMSNPNVDTSRIYVTGVSMGSFGTWDILRRNPSLFAAAVPMSGGGDPLTADAIKNVPIWAFHGSADDVVGVQSTRDMIDALKAAGGDPNYTEVEGGGHVIWPEMYADPNNTLYSWLFNQHLGGPFAAAPDTATAFSTADLVVTAVPEPASLSLLAIGGIALLKRRRR